MLNWLKETDQTETSPVESNDYSLNNGKRITLRVEGQMINKLVFNQRKKKQNSNLFFFELERKAKLKMDKQNELNDLDKIDTDFLIRTPNDNEYSLELSDKRTMNGNRTYFYEYRVYTYNRNNFAFFKLWWF